MGNREKSVLCMIGMAVCAVFVMIAGFAGAEGAVVLIPSALAVILQAAALFFAFRVGG